MKRTNFVIVLNLFYICIFTSPIQGDRLSVMIKCCKYGEKIYKDDKSCSDNFDPIPDVEDALEDNCNKAVKICCIRKQEAEACKLGRKAALDKNSDCDDHQFAGQSAKTFEQCCNGCRLGRTSAIIGLPCNSFETANSDNWGKAYFECCVEENAPKPLPSPEFCHPVTSCTQQMQCIQTNPGSWCSCQPGYILGPDHRSCIAPVAPQIPCGSAPCQQNQRCVTINPGNPYCQNTRVCPPGYEYNAEQNRCQDIDECTRWGTPCSGLQQCQNTLGSYVCQCPPDQPACLRSICPGPSCPNNPICVGPHCPNYPNCVGPHCPNYPNCVGPHCPNYPNCVGPHCPNYPNCVGPHCPNYPNCVGPHCPNYPNCVGPHCPNNPNCVGGNCPNNPNCVGGNCPNNPNCVGPHCPPNNPNCVGPHCPNNANPLIPCGLYRDPPNPHAGCSCGQGFELDPNRRICIDIDECSRDTHNCKADQVCENTYGGFICNCPKGYFLNDDGDCSDIDECRGQGGFANVCSFDSDCENTEGSYKCNCRDGWRHKDNDDKHCHDINECEEGDNDCEHTCTNTWGSYTCSCQPGYVLQPDGRSCRKALPTDCGNNPGRPCPLPCPQSCSCPTGTTLVSGRCVYQGCPYEDPQRCVLEPTCGPTPCVQTCPPGYVRNSYGQCEALPGRPDCVNNPGRPCPTLSQCLQSCSCPSGTNLVSGKCVYHNPGCPYDDPRQCGPFDPTCRPTPCVNTCPTGYVRNNYGQCEDVNECLQAGVCPQNCINFPGSYQCTCWPGYQLDADGKSCVDINECVTPAGSRCVGGCNNVNGAYNCLCPPGYRLAHNGYSCIDINECLERNDCASGGRNQICVNTRGGYYCKDLQCPPTYHLDYNLNSRCIRNPTVCPQYDNGCRYDSPITMSHQFISLSSNAPIPAIGHQDLYQISITSSFTSLDSNHEVKSVSTGDGVEPAEKNDFILRRPAYNSVMLALVKSLKGPQQLEVDLTVKTYQNGHFTGTALTKIYIDVSKYEF